MDPPIIDPQNGGAMLAYIDLEDVPMDLNTAPYTIPGNDPVSTLKDYMLRWDPDDTYESFEENKISATIVEFVQRYRFIHPTTGIMIRARLLGGDYHRVEDEYTIELIMAPLEGRGWEFEKKIIIEAKLIKADQLQAMIDNAGRPISS